MEDSQYNMLVYIIKLPFVFLFYFLYMFLTMFIPSKYISKIINIESIENHMNIYFKNSLFLKFIALIITIIIYFIFD